MGTAVAFGAATVGVGVVIVVNNVFDCLVTKLEDNEVFVVLTAGKFL